MISNINTCSAYYYIMIQLNSSSSHTLVDLSKITDHSDMTLYVNSRMELVQFSYKDVTYDIDEYEMKEASTVVSFIYKV